jgi:cytochrome c-type biogenesis protein
MLPEGIESAIELGGPVALVAMLAAGLFLGLTPAAYVAGPAVLGYFTVGSGGSRGALLTRALAYVVGAAVPMGMLGLGLGFFGEVVIGAVAEHAVAWYLLVALVTGLMGLLLTGLLVLQLPSYLPMPRSVGSPRDAFLLGLPLGLAACPACTPMLFPIATAAVASGGPVYGAGLLFVFGLGRGVPILVAAASFEALRRLRILIPLGLAAQRLTGWLLLATSAVYLVQVVLVLAGQPTLFV